MISNSTIALDFIACSRLAPALCDPQTTLKDPFPQRWISALSFKYIINEYDSIHLQS